MAYVDYPDRVRVVRKILDSWKARYSRLFWILHSIWALAMGALVLVLARERYGFLPWVAVLLGFTWMSTFVFTRVFSAERSSLHRWARGVISYATRVMYQETLFFLLPFYFSSTTWPSLNTGFTLLLGGLAVFSCLDIPFDRLLHRSQFFASGYFFLVTFATLNFLFPLLFQFETHRSTQWAAILSLGAAVALASPLKQLRQPHRIGGCFLALVLTWLSVRALLPFIPPVPLRLLEVQYAGSFKPDTFTSPKFYRDAVPPGELVEGRLYIVARIFAPVRLPAQVTFQVSSNGKLLRESRVIDVPAHQKGFRIWYAVSSSLLPKEGVASGKSRRIRVEIHTIYNQLVGRSEIEVR